MSTLPFRQDPVVDPVLRSPNDDRLRLLPGDSDWVIRFVSPRQYAAVPDLASRTRTAHSDLASHGISLPPHAFVEVEERPGSGRTAIVATARIAGESLQSAAAHDRAAGQAAEQALIGTLRYYEGTYFARTPYLGDVHLGQFMWGTHASRPAPQAWMVDLDLGAGALPAEASPREIALFHSRIGDLVNDAIELESILGAPFAGFRAAVERVSSGPVFAQPSARGRAQRMTGALEAGTPFLPVEEWAHPLFD